VTPEGGAPRRVVVSVHDVAPSTLPNVRWLLERLSAAGVPAGRRVLKVIPDELGAGGLRRDDEAATLLREEADRGSEIVLHGLTHRAPRGASPGGGPLNRLRARLFAGAAAEFLALDHAAAGARVDAGFAILAAVGLQPAGFCAPGWLARPGLADVLRERGLRYAVWFASVEDLAARPGSGRRRHRIPALGYMGAGGSSEALVGVERVLVATAASRLRTVRVFLHPQGAATSPACAATLRALERILRTHAPATYTEVLGA